MERTGSFASSLFPKGRGSKKKKGKETGRKGKSTPLMQKHHHATFSHLVHDALLRLNCAPSPTHRGASKKSIAHNIERHYRLKLGRKFDKRLRLSLTRLVNQGRLVRTGNTSPKYKLSLAFEEHFKRLRVIHGDANRRHGVLIQRTQRRRRRSRSSSRGGTHKKRRSIYSFLTRLTGKRRSRSRSRARSRSKSRSKSRTRSRFRSKSRSKSRTRSRFRSKSRSRSRRTHRSRRSSRSRRKHRSRSGRRRSEKRKSKSRSPSRGGGSKKNSSITSWFWPASSGDSSKRPPSAPSSPPNKAASASRHSGDHTAHGSRRFSSGLGRVFRRFKRGRSRERASSSSGRGHRGSKKTPEGPSKSQRSLGPPCRCKAFPLPHHHRSSNPTVPYPSTSIRSRSRSKPRVTKVSSLADDVMETNGHEESNPGKEYTEDAHNAPGQTSSLSSQITENCDMKQPARSSGRYINAPVTSRLKSLLQE